MPRDEESVLPPPSDMAARALPGNRAEIRLGRFVGLLCSFSTLPLTMWTSTEATGNLRLICQTPAGAAPYGWHVNLPLSSGLAEAMVKTDVNAFSAPPAATHFDPELGISLPL